MEVLNRVPIAVHQHTSNTTSSIPWIKSIEGRNNRKKLQNTDRTEETNNEIIAMEVRGGRSTFRITLGSMYVVLKDTSLTLMKNNRAIRYLMVMCRIVPVMNNQESAAIHLFRVQSSNSRRLPPRSRMHPLRSPTITSINGAILAENTRFANSVENMSITPLSSIGFGDETSNRYENEIQLRLLRVYKEREQYS
jgi:hypothetical protein